MQCHLFSSWPRDQGNSTTTTTAESFLLEDAIALNHRENQIETTRSSVMKPSPQQTLDYFWGDKIPRMVFNMAEQTGVQVLVLSMCFSEPASIMHKQGIINNNTVPIYQGGFQD